MIHLVCDCGALVSTPPSPGPREVPCRSCGKGISVPGAGEVGLEAPAAPPAPRPAVAAPPVPAEPPRFDADERLDLVVLEREAARLQAMGVLALVAGAAGAGAAAVVPGLPDAVRVMAGAAALFVAVAAWTLFRGARAACRAALALAQRQRELLRRAA